MYVDATIPQKYLLLTEESVSRYFNCRFDFKCHTNVCKDAWLGSSDNELVLVSEEAESDQVLQLNIR